MTKKKLKQMEEKALSRAAFKEIAGRTHTSTLVLNRTRNLGHSTLRTVLDHGSPLELNSNDGLEQLFSWHSHHKNLLNGPSKPFEYCQWLFPL